MLALSVGTVTAERVGTVSSPGATLSGKTMTLSSPEGVTVSTEIIISEFSFTGEFNR